MPVITLQEGDGIGSVALARGVETDAPAARATEWLGGRVGLRNGESVVSAHVFTPALGSSENEPGAAPVVARDDWAQTEVHQHSEYWCFHCGEQHEDPAGVYECIDRHAAGILSDVSAEADANPVLAARAA